MKIGERFLCLASILKPIGPKRFIQQSLDVQYLISLFDSPNDINVTLFVKVGDRVLDLEII